MQYCNIILRRGSIGGMARRVRVEVEGVLYHVITRGSPTTLSTEALASTPRAGGEFRDIFHSLREMSDLIGINRVLAT